MQKHGRNPKQANDIFEKELPHLWGCQFPRPSKHRYQTRELTVFTHAADKPIVTTNQWHAKYKVNSPPLKFLVWQGQGLQKASRQGVHIFDALAHRAALDKCMLRQIRPLVALLQCGNSFLHTQVRRIQQTVQL